MMENKIFYNGVNFARSILSKVCEMDGLGAIGMTMVLDNLVDSLLDYLHEHATVVPVDGEMVDVLSYKLDEEDYQIPDKAAAMMLAQEREVHRLIHERLEAPRRLMMRVGDTMVISVNSAEELLEMLKAATTEDLGSAKPDAEFSLAMAFADLYDEWSEEDLGGLHPALYDMLKMGQNACETALTKLDGRLLEPEEMELQREGYEALDAINERLDDLLIDYPEYADDTDGERGPGNGDIWGDGPIFPYS